MYTLIPQFAPDQFLGLALAQSLFAPAHFFVFALIQSVLFLLLIRFLDLYEREPFLILALMAIWGAIGATLLSLPFNEIAIRVLGKALGVAVGAPVVEEISKGLALVAAFVLSQFAARRFGMLHFSGVTDGIVYGAAVGVGFSFMEDIQYFWNFTSQQGVEAGLRVYLERVDLLGTGGFGHSIYTGAFGAGLGLATWSRGQSSKILFPLLGLGAAIFMHMTHNGLAVLGAEGLMTFSDFVWVVAFFLAIALWLRYQRQVIRFELGEEVNTGLISQAEWDITPRYWRRSRWYWQVLLSGKLEQWRALRRLHNELVDLAFLKWRLRRRQGGDWGQVERLRRRIYNLKTQEVVEQGLISYSRTSLTANTAAAGAAVDATATNATATDPATSSSPADTSGTAQPAEPQTRHCIHCGAELGPSARFCTSCGARVAS